MAKVLDLPPLNGCIPYGQARPSASPPKDPIGDASVDVEYLPHSEAEAHMSASDSLQDFGVEEATPGKPVQDGGHQPETPSSPAPNLAPERGSARTSTRDSMGSVGSVESTSQPRSYRTHTCKSVTIQSSRLRRASAIAIDFNLRAKCSTEESLQILKEGLAGSFGDPATRLGLGSAATRRLRGLLRGEGIASLLRTLAVLSIVAAPTQLSVEATCHRPTERTVAAALKMVHLAASLVYMVCAIGQLWAIKWQPIVAIASRLHGVVTGASPLAPLRLEDNFMDMDGETCSKSGDPSSVLTRRSWLLLDFFALVALLGELGHLFEEPMAEPTWLQWLWFLNVVKAWRWVAPAMVTGDSQEASEGFSVKVAELFGCLFLFSHLCACVFSLAALYESGQGMPTWADDIGSLADAERSCTTFYMAAFYFAAYTVTSIGHGDIVPANTFEQGLDAFIMIISQMYMAKVFADLNFLISTHNYWRAQRHQRLTQTSAALKSMGVPQVLRQRVLSYQEFVWEVQKERRAKESIGDLSTCLKGELQIIVYRRLVVQAPFLHQLSVEALHHIICSLTDTVHLPSDFIVRRGDEGSELYFLREGRAGIFLTEEAPVWSDEEFKVVRGGDYFGEVALLTGQKRSSWVMARTYCVCSLLHKRVIDEVIASDPSCVVRLACSMQKALKLKPHLNWSDIAERLDKVFPELEDLWCYLQCVSPDKGGVGVVSWSMYQTVMQQIKVNDCDQKLLWIDVDSLAEGVVPFEKFVKVAYNGARDEEAADTMELMGNGEFIGRKSDMNFVPLMSAMGTSADLSVAKQRSDVSSMMASRRPSQDRCLSPSLSPAEKQLKLIQQQLVKFEERVDGRLDDLTIQVALIMDKVNPPPESAGYLDTPRRRKGLRASST